MQPYFLPYLGYWQLVNAVDAFVVYDQIEYTKKGWINRNRILSNGSDSYITLPLKKDSDHLSVCERELAADFYKKEASSLIRKVEGAYRRASFFQEGMAFFDSCFQGKELNLFQFLYQSIRKTLDFLHIQTPIVVSSALDFDKSLRGQDRVIAICRSLGCAEYINPPGGRHLYEADSFKNQGISLGFLELRIAPYPQVNSGEFIEHLSILDLIMNLGSESTSRKLSECLIE